MIKSDLLKISFVILIHICLISSITASFSKYCTGNANDKQNPACRKLAEERWFFNENTNKCEPFQYTGCFIGEFHNFHSTHDECVRVCERGEMPMDRHAEKEEVFNSVGMVTPQMYMLALPLITYGVYIISS